MLKLYRCLNSQVTLLLETVVRDGVNSVAISMDGSVLTVGSKYSFTVFSLDLNRLVLKQI